MKRQLFLLVALITMSATALNAQQFTNAGFENWTGLAPDGWNSIGYMGMNLCEVVPTTDSYSGEKAISVSAKMLPEQLAAMMGIDAFPIPGILTNATIDMQALLGIMMNPEAPSLEDITSLMTGGLEITENPTSVTGYMKLDSMQDNDVYIMAALLIKNVDSVKTIIGVGMQTNADLDGSDSGYQPHKTGYSPFELDIEVFVPGLVADELVFVSVISPIIEMEEKAPSFGKLILDDLLVNYNSVGMESLELDAKKVYPNPSNGSIRIDCEANAQITILNTLGQEVKKIENYNPNSIINLDRKGMYFVRINSENNQTTQKIVVR